MFCELEDFSIVTSLWLHKLLLALCAHHSNHLGLFFLQPWVVFSCVCTGHDSAEDSGSPVQIFRVLSLSLSVHLSPLQHSALRLPATLASLASWLHLLNSGSLPGCAWAHPPCAAAYKHSRQWARLTVGLAFLASSP